VTLRNNLLVGPGKAYAGPDADVAGDVRADWGVFVQANREDYRLTPAARSQMGAQALALLPEALQPKQEYRHPLQAVPLPELVRFPGALQSAAP
jgi:hypothetical protein